MRTYRANSFRSSASGAAFGSTAGLAMVVDEALRVCEIDDGGCSAKKPASAMGDYSINN